MRVAVAADHAGFDLKELVRAHVAAAGHAVVDLGTDSPMKPDDYPDFARAIGEALVTGKADRGILVCGSGVGASVAANKIPGVRAGLCHDHYSAHQGVEHDDMNVLVLGARVIGTETAKDLVAAFLAAKFTGEERHLRRLNKVKEIESNPPRGAKYPPP
jgi:ribose 5-phosphate isomerase B